ncbi:MAG: class I SAM-dependent methyltransferase [Desulfovibrionaceae bacterium]|nr:class I SAM-dependent methyltransferase [Desulfovibrionaceae bacterium]
MTKTAKTTPPLSGKDAFDGSFLCPDGEFDKITGRTEYLKQAPKVLEDKFYFDKKKGALRPECLARRDCPVCGHPGKGLAFSKQGFDHVLCDKCSFLYVDPILSPEAMQRHYEEEDEWTKVMLNEFEQRVNKKMYSYTLEVIKGLDLGLRRVIDIGAGTGLFVESAAEAGFQAEGLEINPNLVRRAKNRGTNLFSATLNELGSRGKRYDLATSWFVLEHVPNPREFLLELSGLVRPGGLVYVSVPNIDALATRLQGPESATFAGNSHINFFNRESLFRVAKDCGLRPIHAETYVTRLKAIKDHFARLGLSRQSSLRDFLGLFTSEFIHNKLMGNLLCCLFAKDPVKNEND